MDVPRSFLGIPPDFDIGGLYVSSVTSDAISLSTDPSIISGFTNRDPPVASPTLQQSNVVQSHSDQSHLTPPSVSYSKPKKERTLRYDTSLFFFPSNKRPCLPIHYSNFPLSNPPLLSPSECPDVHPNCGHISYSADDLKRHMETYWPISVDEPLEFIYGWCGRTGAKDFKREDHYKKQCRKVHMNEKCVAEDGQGGEAGDPSRDWSTWFPGTAGKPCTNSTPSSSCEV